jgi:hypothetical protein
MIPGVEGRVAGTLRRLSCTTTICLNKARKIGGHSVETSKQRGGLQGMGIWALLMADSTSTQHHKTTTIFPTPAMDSCWVLVAAWVRCFGWTARRQLVTYCSVDIILYPSWPWAFGGAVSSTTGLYKPAGFFYQAGRHLQAPSSNLGSSSQSLHWIFSLCMAFSWNSTLFRWWHWWNSMKSSYSQCCKTLRLPILSSGRLSSQE